MFAKPIARIVSPVLRIFANVDGPDTIGKGQVLASGLVATDSNSPYDRLKARNHSGGRARARGNENGRAGHIFERILYHQRDGLRRGSLLVIADHRFEVAK